MHRAGWGASLLEASFNIIPGVEMQTTHSYLLHIEDFKWQMYIYMCVCMCVCVISINFMESPWQGWVLGTMMHHASQASHLDDGHRKEGRNLWFLRDNLKVLGV